MCVFQAINPASPADTPSWSSLFLQNVYNIIFLNMNNCPGFLRRDQDSTLPGLEETRRGCSHCRYAQFYSPVCPVVRWCWRRRWGGTTPAILSSLPQSPDWPKNEKKRSKDPRCFMNLSVLYCVFGNLNHTFMFESGVFCSNYIGKHFAFNNILKVQFINPRGVSVLASLLF